MSSGLSADDSVFVIVVFPVSLVAIQATIEPGDDDHWQIVPRSPEDRHRLRHVMTDRLGAAQVE